MRSTISAMAPSPVTFVAVPNESIAMYVATMRATCGSVKPSIEESRPEAATIAPPGTPGAATMVTPSIRMKPIISGMSTVPPDRTITAREKATIFTVEPARWTVAQSGITNEAIGRRTPVLIDWRRVTGMVAAEDEVPSAVA